MVLRRLQPDEAHRRLLGDPPAEHAGQPGPGSVISPRHDARPLRGKPTWSLSPNHNITASIFGDPERDHRPRRSPIAGPEHLERRRQDRQHRPRRALRRRLRQHLPVPGHVRPALGGEHGRAGRASRSRSSSTSGQPELRGQRLRVLHQDQEFTPRRLQGRPHQVPGQARDQGRRRLRADQHDQRQLERRRRRSGSSSAAAAARLLPPPLLPDDLAPASTERLSTWQIAAAAHLRAPLEELLRVLPGQLEDRVVLHLEPRRPLRAAGRAGPVRRERLQARPELGPAPRVHLGRDQGRQEQALRELRPLLRERAPGHQHPRVRRRGPVLLLQLQLEPRRHLPGPERPRRQSLLGGATPVDPGAEGQFIDEYMGGFEYEVRRTASVGIKFTYRDAWPRIEDFLVAPRTAILIANLGEGTSGKTTTSTTSSPRRRRRRPTRQNYGWEVTARKRFSNNWQFLAATSGPSSKATTTASSRTRPASSTRTSTRPSTTPTSWSTRTAASRPSASTS